ncbi:MAG: electron transfer flavoprotein subunit beta/FixA family protein [Candidatus Lindowbacteria bacterium]|nr:electron transfer flavoprotein subunit beta/FixA family protein [Candidatus Lindowbacteria bacterium]
MNATGLNIVVLLASVHDCQNPVLINSVRKRIDPSSIHWVLNPPDTLALEQALRLRDQIPRSRIRVVSVAPPSAERVLRECLAVGADELVRFWDDGVEDADCHAIAAILAAIIRTEPFHLILAGWQRADMEHAQTGSILAELLGLPQITCARKVELASAPAHIRVEKRIPGWLLTVSCALPALVTMEKGPPLRYPKYLDRREARRARILDLDLKALGLSEAPQSLIRLERVTPPKPRRRSAMGDGANMPVMARLQRIMAGGAQAKKETNVHQCPDRSSTLKVIEHMLKERLVELPEKGGNGK